MANILVVEDEENIRFLLHEQFGSMGHRVVLAENGKQGIDYVKSQPFDLIITDLNMPGVSGIELISTIRYQLEIEDEASKTPIIVVTAYPKLREDITLFGEDIVYFDKLRFQSLL